MKSISTILAAAMLLPASAVMAQNAGETNFSYAEGPSTKAIGFGKYIDHDVAIQIKNQSLVGYEVLGISVDIPNVEGCSCRPEARAWLTQELFVHPETYENLPDITEEGVPGTIVNYGTAENPEYRLDIDFPEPYKITEEGVFVGYTVTVTSLKNWRKNYPVALADSENPSGGLWMHSGYNSTIAAGNYKQWNDLSAAQKAVSTMRVRLRGTKPALAAVIEPVLPVYGVKDSQYCLAGTLFNHGTDAVSAVEYVITAAAGENSESFAVSGTLSLEVPLAGGESVNVALPYTFPSVSADYEVTLSTKTVNGEANQYKFPDQNFAMAVRDWIPKRRALVEEYTGLWCGYCPEAYVQVAQQRDLRPDDFVTIVFHKDDSMTAISPSNQPFTGAGAPKLYVNRNTQVGVLSELGNHITQGLYDLAPAEVEATLYWEDATKQKLRAEAKVKFAEDAEADSYRIGFALVEDNMTDPDWKQHNYFWDTNVYKGDYYKQPYWDLFYGKTYEVTGIVYDDVAMSFPHVSGRENSIPDAVKMNDVVSDSMIFDPSEIVNQYTGGVSYGKPVVKNYDNLRVVVTLHDRNTGECVNAASTGYAANAVISGVETLPAEGSVAVAREYYTLDGVRLSQAPEKGAVIIVTRYSDGTVKTAKRLQ